MANPAASPRTSHKRYFFEKFGIAERLLERCLGEALSAGGDYADLYFESVTATSLGVDEQIVKSASQGTSAGCGIRVLSGERTGYAYTDNLSPERLLHAARTAALIASGPAKQTVQGFVEAPAADLYPVPLGGYDLDLAARLELILRADRAARAYDPRIVQVRAGYSEELRRILIAASDGAFASDTQPLCRLNVLVIAKDGANTTKGSAGGGGRAGLDQFAGSKSPESLRRPARWKWCWGRAGRESCCMRRWDTGWKPTSTARRLRHSPGRSASRWPAPRLPWWTTEPSPAGAVRSTWTTRARRLKKRS
jgi:TldD protein